MMRIGRLSLIVALLWAGGAHAQQALQIRIGAAYTTDQTTAFIGVEKGIFAKHGLDAKLVMYQTGVEMINGLMSGAQEVNVMGSIPFLAGVSRGQPLVMIGHQTGDALADNYSQNNAILTTPQSGIIPSDIQTLRGKKIGLARGTGSEGYLLGILAQSGLKSTDMTLINIPPANTATALRQGDVHAIAAWEPWATVTQLRVPGAIEVIRANCSVCYEPGVLLTTRATIDQKSEALRRFMVAFAEASQWLRHNYDEASEIAMRWVPGLELDVVKVAIRHSLYDIRLSKNTIDGYNEKEIPALVADKRMAKMIEASTVIDAQFYKHVEAVAPQFFSDLKPIPTDRRL